ncbi:insulinase family protein [Aquibacillus sp. 3ASR75-11]|uniref:Insulinase family protein n=1 Tax=Terrihalobacillus insolitus TaxID=2950438 RepID=A0A9X4AMI0_9BACI|nr:pitrilysin family protein [Terrihalobacillus insolitus]MDC3414092.1 insulinase family protein [Terrihalobacillus insolitus]MDC3423533.1 insulinase family protein [Terrihalobacillus insolitus]
MLHTHTCKNGLRIVLEDMPAVRSVTIGIWVYTGSRSESDFNNGVSHFLEHMFFKGTEKRSAKDIAEAFDAIGGQVNAFTSKEYTCFYAKVMDTHKDYALDILSDMFFHSTFDKEELEREKKVVLEEIKMSEDTPDDIVHDLLSEASYGKHPLGFPILGTENTLRSLSADDLRSYMDQYYGPENVVISVAGNVDETYIKTIENRFGTYTTSQTKKSFETPSFLSKHIEKRKETEQAHLCIGYRGLPVDADKMYSLIVMNNVFGGSMSSRLFQEIREQRGLAYSVFSYHSSFVDNGLLTIYVGTSKEHLPVLRETIDVTIQDLMTNGLTDKELINSKEQLKGNLMLSLESTNARMSRNGKNELILKRHRTLDEMITAINAVNHTSINEVIQLIFDQQSSSALVSS